LYSARDISDAIQAKKDREAKEQKSEFLAIMAHEIRTPLHQITGFIDLLDQTTDLDEEQRSYVKPLKTCTKGLLTVISDVLDYSKLEAGKMKIECIPYEPKSVLEGALEAVRATCEEKDLSLTMDWGKEIPFTLSGDPNRLRQILLNLLSNAVKFTKRGGIHVQVRTDFPGPDLQKCRKRKVSKLNNREAQDTKLKIKFVVIDTGLGIMEEHQKLIFHRYHQGALSVAREHGGTGLGLSICKLLVERMGGRIGVQSDYGLGSSFWFCLPADIPSEPEVPEPTEEDTDETDGMTILVAEDNKINQKLVKRMLERLGHRPIIAENGKEAIEMVERDTFDLVLMDVQMPVMDGIEATRRLRMLGYSDLPIVGLTASVTRSDFADLGFNDWLAKPVPLKELRIKLRQYQKSCLVHKVQ
jgi:CheY-like chemotaxis protein/nitrogen-specific signal transduction histidine kinase